MAKAGDSPGGSGDASLRKEARSLFGSQDISRRVWTVLAICRDMTGIGVEPWIVVVVHTLIVTQLCIFTKEARQEERGARLLLALVGQETHLLDVLLEHAT